MQLFSAFDHLTRKTLLRLDIVETLRRLQSAGKARTGHEFAINQSATL
jgi:hypothetical protein